MSYDPELKLIKLLWSERTADMTDGDFKEALELFARYAIKYKAARLLVDLAQFRHKPAPELGKWRIETIVPKYNEAGVKQFAYIIGKRSPVPPSGPPKDGEGFSTRFFDAEDKARAWFQES